jgi:hypothetical protein
LTHFFSECFVCLNFSDSNSKKSCQGCELPSDDIPDSTSNSRGHNNNTPSATNNNNQPNSSTNCSNSNGSAGVVNSTNSTGLTPNSTIDMGASPALNASSSNVISADSSVASSGSMEEEDEIPTKIKKKDDGHVSIEMDFKPKAKILALFSTL